MDVFLPSYRFLLLSFSVIISSLVCSFSLWDALCFSATGELRVRENTSAIECVRILRDVGHSEVVLGLAKLIGDLWVNVVLSASHSGVNQVLSHVRLFVLFALPH